MIVTIRGPFHNDFKMGTFIKTDTINHLETLTFILNGATQFHCVKISPVIELLHSTSSCIIICHF